MGKKFCIALNSLDNEQTSRPSSVLEINFEIIFDLFYIIGQTNVEILGGCKYQYQFIFGKRFRLICIVAQCLQEIISHTLFPRQNVTATLNFQPHLKSRPIFTYTQFSVLSGPQRKFLETYMFFSFCYDMC
jgi:hypothetical protein